MRFTKTVPLAVAAVLVLPGAALAKDRNHDGLPDGWEKAHNLSLRVNQAHRDQDHDGLDNRAEFRHHTNPRHANTKFVGQASQNSASPDNGNAGTVTSFTNGILTITLNDGSTLKGAVTPQTEVKCEGAAGQNDQNDQGDDNGTDRARIASDGGGDNSGPGDGDQGDRNDQGDANDNQGDDNDADEQQPAGQPSSCMIAQGDPVREADLKATSSGAVFEEVKLAK